VGDLRKALEDVPDSLAINVNVTTTDVRGAPDGFLSFAITSAEVGMTNVGDDHEPEPYSYFEVNLDGESIGGALLYVPWPGP
jgi:hypothetical protein